MPGYPWVSAGKLPTLMRPESLDVNRRRAMSNRRKIKQDKASLVGSRRNGGHYVHDDGSIGMGMGPDGKMTKVFPEDLLPGGRFADPKQKLSVDELKSILDES
jgi:hypothetical protein